MRRVFELVHFDLNQISSLVGTSLRAWHKGVFGRPAQARGPAAMQELRLVVDGVDGKLREGVVDGLVGALNQQGVTVTNQASARWTLQVHASVDRKSRGQAPVGQWRFTMLRADGQQVGQASYVSELPGFLNERALSQVSRMAVGAYADFIADRLRVAPATAHATAPATATQ